jgi:threonyl-tRNA synthetase
MEKERLQVLRHSTAHVMAQAVKELYPQVRLGIGPPTEDGFYYDFDGDLSEDDLPRIEEKMREIIARDIPFVRQEVSKEEAERIFQERGETYKLELLQDIPDDRVSLYWQGSFVDLCRGPHVESTGQIKAFKLLSVAGAYWRGDERNQMLKRIYGTAFFSEEELQAYLTRLEEAKKRDHRKLGKELELFSFHEEVGAGFVIWHHYVVMIFLMLV